MEGTFNSEMKECFIQYLTVIIELLIVAISNHYYQLVKFHLFFYERYIL